MKGRVTKTGYRRNSPDVNNDYNVIPSNRISMAGVDFPVLGIDNLGNSELMYPGGEYEFQGDYVTELPAYGSGGLTQWFAEKWVDIKTGKECGRSGKDKNGRPYPACRPSKRVNSTTPKTSKEMSAKEKAKFKKSKTSGKRINYNHKRAQEGIEVEPASRRIRYEDGRIKLQDPAIWDGFLNEVTVTPDTKWWLDWQEGRANLATGGLKPVYPIFDVMTLGLKAPATAGAKAIQAGIKKAPSKINPRYFQPNSNMYYRGIGRGGMEDALESGLFRAKPSDKIPPSMVDLGVGQIDMAKRFNKTYYSPQFSIADRYGAGYIAEVPKDAAKFGRRYKGSDWSMATKDQIPINEGRILEKNWWSGYKPIKEYGGSLDKAQEGIEVGNRFLPPAIRNMQPKEDPIYYDGIVGETTVTAPRAGKPSISDYIEYRKQAGEAIPESSAYHYSHKPAPINSSQSFIGADRSGGIGALKAIAKGAKGLLGLKGSADDLLRTGEIGQFADDVAPTFKYKPGTGNPYQNLNVTDDLFQGVPHRGAGFLEDSTPYIEEIKTLGRELDEIGFDANWVGPEHLRYRGNTGGRSIVEVALPGKSKQTQLFYKSTGYGNKAGAGVNGTTQDLWQAYPGHMDLLADLKPGQHLGQAKVYAPNWFMKGPGAEEVYNVKSFKSVADRLDDLTKEAGFDLSAQIGKYQEGREVKGRMGVRPNADGTKSTHLMSREYVDGKGWVAFPTLFQNPDSSWVDMSKDKSWYPVYEEAMKRGEVYEFGEDLEAAKRFADEGSWKKKYQTGRQVGPPSLTPGPIQDKVYPMITGPVEDNLENRIVNGRSSAPKDFSRRDALLNASKRVSEGQGGRPLEVLLNMTAVMENSLGDNPKAYGRDYTRSQMSIDDNAYADLFEPRGEYDYTSSQKKGFEWLKGMGYEPTKMDSILRTDDPVAAMATARLVYGRAPGALPNPDSPKEVYSYYMDNYNKSGALKYGDDEKHYKRFLDAYNDLYQKEAGGESIPSFDIYDTYQRAWLAARKKLGPNKKFIYQGIEESTNT